jgi:hypothetical protein
MVDSGLGSAAKIFVVVIIFRKYYDGASFPPESA